MRFPRLLLAILAMITVMAALYWAEADETPTVVISPDPLEFSDTRVGEVADTQVATVTKDSSKKSLQISSVRIANSTDFHIVSDKCTGTVLGSSESCEIGLSFEPSAAGHFSTSLSVVSAARKVIESSTVEGGGVAPAVTLSAASIDFGDETVDQVSAAYHLILVNSGNDTLNISSIEVIGEFSESDDCGEAVASSASCTLGITFVPPSTGDFAGTVTITDDAVDSPQTVGLSGTGVEATQPDIHLSKHALDFGGVPIDTASDAKTVTVTNTGTADLAIYSITASENFDETGDCGETLPSAETCTLSVTFTPPSSGNFSGTVTIVDNASDSPQAVSLIGIGLTPGSPEVDLSATSLDFGEQAVDEASEAKTVTVTNGGTEDLVIQAVTIEGDKSHSYSEQDDCQGSTLAGGESCTISSTFTPVEEGVLSATISIGDNASDSPQTVILSGTGVQSSEEGGGGCSLLYGR